jgi:hypothetical protein
MNTKIKQVKYHTLIALLIIPVTLFFGFIDIEANQDFEKLITGIAVDIAKLKHRYPQLANFSSKKHTDIKNLSISYDYRTHQPERRPGWVGSVPNPDNDGVWFYIDLHDPSSMAQIHTQPVTLPMCVGEKRVSFLILEGKRTKSLGKDITLILKRHGVEPCKH